MSSQPRTEAHAPPQFLKVTAAWPWQLVLSAGVLVGLTAMLYAHVLALMVANWWSDPNWGHGFLVPFFAGWVAWRERRHWLRTGEQGSWFGSVGVAGAIMLLMLGSLAAELFTTRFSFVLLLASTVLLVGGWRRLRALRFPLCFLLLMIPWPTVTYIQTTLPLEFLSSKLAAAALRVVHIPVFREGNLLVLSNYTLQVAEACSGIRSLVSLITVAVAYSYLMEKKVSIRVALVVLMVPIAVVSNAFRIFGTGVLTTEISPSLAHGFFHEFSGGLIFLSAVCLMLMTHWILRRILTRKEADHA